MVLTVNFERFGEFAELDPSTGTLQSVDRATLPEETWPILRGHYCMFEGSMLVLYREDGDLRLRIDEDPISLDNSTSISWKQVRGNVNWRFRLAEWTVHTEARDYSWRYRNWRRVGPKLTSFATFGEELEHFDFGLFVTSVVNDPVRRERIYTGDPS